jgi:hypothetical protein
MHPQPAAFFQFRDVLRSITPLPEAHRILVLKVELLHALERASHSERRSHMLERELERLRARGPAESGPPHLARGALERELADARRDLARSKVRGQERLRAMQLQVLSMEVQCATLDEVCRSLLLTIERAACSELAPPTEPKGKHRVSA